MNFLYWVSSAFACWLVFHFSSINLFSCCWNIFTALSGFDTIILGSKLANFLAKLYWRGLLFWILETTIASIIAHSFLNSKACNWLTIFSFRVLLKVAAAANQTSICDAATWLTVSSTLLLEIFNGVPAASSSYLFTNSPIIVSSITWSSELIKGRSGASDWKIPRQCFRMTATDTKNSTFTVIKLSCTAGLTVENVFDVGIWLFGFFKVPFM